MSLNDVSAAAGISAATLSRIETAKQGVDVEMLVTLAKVLHVSAAQVLDSSHHSDGEESLVAALSTLSYEEQTRIVVAAGRQRPAHGPRAQLENQLDTLLATIDLIREELRDIQRQTHRRR